MAVQALPVIVGNVEVKGLHWPADILSVNVVQSPPLRPDSPVKDIILMAGVAGFLSGNAMVLEVSCREVMRVIHVKAPSVRFHDVAGEAECGLFGAFHLFRGTEEATQDWQSEQCDEGEDFSVAVRGERGAKNEHEDQAYAQREQKQGERLRRNHADSSPFKPVTTAELKKPPNGAYFAGARERMYATRPVISSALRVFV